MTIRHKILTALTRLPNFRGKVKVLKVLHEFFLGNSNNSSYLHRLNNPIPFKVYLDNRCAHELMAYLMNGYEQDTTLFLDKLFDQSGYFLDIGANIGLISIPFVLKQNEKQNSQSAKAYCVEAVLSNNQILNKNIIENNLQNQITTFNLGLGDKEKIVDIQVEGNRKEGDGTGTANILPSESNYQCERIKLPITTIDTLVKNKNLPKNCSLIKIDTDGYDLFIMQGAENLLRTARPIIYGEFSAHCLNWHSQSITDVVTFMDSLEYTVLRKDTDNWIFTKTLDPSSYITDLLLIPNEKFDETISKLDIK